MIADPISYPRPSRTGISLRKLSIEVSDVEENEHVSMGFVHFWRFFSPHRVGRLQKPAEGRSHAPDSRKEGGGHVARSMVGLSHARLNAVRIRNSKQLEELD
jgi:hypothetical protein